MSVEKKIQNIQFGLCSPEEIIRQSVAEIYTHEYFDPHGNARDGGLFDPRLGCLERNKKCQTCNEGFLECPGHFGHMTLAVPIYHVAFLPKITKILRCFCFHCSRLLIDKQHLKRIRKSNKNMKKRFDEIYTFSLKKSTCSSLEIPPLEDSTTMSQGCGKPQPTYKRVEISEFYAQWSSMAVAKAALSSHGKVAPSLCGMTVTISGNGRVSLNIHQIRQLLSRIDDENATAIGFPADVSRPEWTILLYLPISPPVIRPSSGISYNVREQTPSIFNQHVQSSSNSASLINKNQHHDDLTLLYTNIIKKNNEIKTERNFQNTEYILKCKQLQHLISYLFGSDIGGKLNTQNSMLGPTKQYKSLKDRLKGKDGRIRGNLMGKRVDFSARTVITGDPNLRIDEVGIPKSIAQSLTYPEHVTMLNIDHLQALVDTPLGRYPNANYVIDDHGKRTDLTIQKQKSSHRFILQPGYIVERQLQNGDAVVFNRQPTLHKMSMMGHRVRVLPWSTFRMNLSCTTPYNADFDGDEMNLHVPQSIQTRTEVEQILLTTRQMITPQSSKPVMGIVQDALTAVYKMTSRDVFLDWHDVQNLIMHIPFDSFPQTFPNPAIIKPKPLWTGKQIFSVIIPGCVTLIRTQIDHDDAEDDDPIKKWSSPKDTKVFIDNGQLLCGTLCKRTLGTSAGSLLHICYLDFGHEKCAAFYNNIQTLSNEWLRTVSHTVSIADIKLPKTHDKYIKQGIESAKQEAKSLLLNPRRDTTEQKINQILNNARENSGRIVRNHISNRNSLKCMVISGSKGSDINISQIVACVGQQNVQGHRIPDGFRHRTLPHFPRFDNSPEAKGFVGNSYFTGLSPSEFFFHAMGGREGLIDTAIKTAQTGYIQRRLIKSMESLMVHYDGTVRNSAQELYQFHYGEDGFAAEFIENVNLQPIISDVGKHKTDISSYASLYAQYDLNFTSEQASLSQEWSCLDTLRHEISLLQKGFVYDPYTSDSNYNPENSFDEKKSAKLFPKMTYENLLHDCKLPCNIDRLLNSAKRTFTHSHLIPTPSYIFTQVELLLEKCAGYKYQPQNHQILFQFYVRAKLTSRNILLVHKLNSSQFDWICDEIESKYHSALAQPGEMVGALAAQSIGEPATQMTLNTFHHAGVSSKNVTLGVPRLQEILNATKNPKSPSLTIHIKPEHQNAQIVEKIHWQLQYTTIKHLVDYTSIYYDPNINDTCITSDKEMLDLFLSLCDFDTDTLCDWVLRLVFNGKKLIASTITLELISDIIHRQYKGMLKCMYSDENCEIPVMHVRIDVGEFNQPIDNLGVPFIKDLEEKMILPLKIQGIEQISDIYNIKQNDQWVLKTNGSNLLQVLNNKYVDFRKTTSNDIHQVYTVLGIEAARLAIEQEIYHVLKMYGLEVNHRHISLLCDTITAKGAIMGITRHGINRQETGPLVRCSFEETVNVLSEAAVHGERDSICGISENIILGQIPPMGTGAFDIFLDARKCEQIKNIPETPTTVQLPNKHNDNNFTNRETNLQCDADSPYYNYHSPDHYSQNNDDLTNSPQPLYHPSSPTYDY